VNLEEYERMYDAEDRQWWYAGMRAISLALLRPQLSPGARILDAGCGTGRNLEEFAVWARPSGVDLSEEALRFCRRRGVPAARGRVQALPFPQDAFDAVTSFDVLYHRWIEDDAAAVAELVRVLRPGGVLLVRVPALKLLWGAHDAAVHSRHRYNSAEVRALLESQGLRVVKLSYANTLLFPVIALRRLLDRLTGREGSDVGFLPAPLEWAFGSLLRLEARVLPRLSFPVGASVFALARKPGPA
jgi:SAM-dependent methyltransferase